MKFKHPYCYILSGFLVLSIVAANTGHMAAPKMFKRGLMASDSLLIAEAHQKWRQLVNTEVDSLGVLYSENALKVTASGEVLEGAPAIVDSYRSPFAPVDSIRSVHTYRAVLDSAITYEIGRYWTAEQDFAHLIIWRERDGSLKRELEFVAPMGSTPPLKQEIETSRQQWMTLCNAHDAAHLVATLYTDNALYYNHKPMVIGKEAITGAYGYMNDANYELVLEPFVVETVAVDLAFEIGQCSGSYPGNYVLIWQKDAAGAWQILFDSNI